MIDAQTRASGRLRAHRIIDRNKAGFVRMLREDRESLVSSEEFGICRFPRHGLCTQPPNCPWCMRVDFADPRTDAEIANIIIAGN